jgi:hypothetical protein
MTLRISLAPARNAIAATAALLPLLGCLPDGEAPPPPSAGEVRSHYAYEGSLDVEMSGNVAQISVTIDRDQFLMGGALWAKAAPYIFLFSPSTREALETLPGLGGVRIIVNYENGAMVGQALLERSTLNSVGWDRALNVAGLARTQGTQSPGYMRDLVSWGEDHTEFQYNPEYIPGAS